MFVPDADEIAGLEQNRWLFDLAAAALRSNDLEAALADACQQLATAMQAEFVQVVDPLPDAGAASVCAGFGWRPGVVGAGSLPVPPGTLAEQVLRSGRAANCADAHSRPDISQTAYLAEHGVRSSAAALLKPGYGGAAQAVLQVDCCEPRSWTESEMGLLRQAGSLIAAMLQRMQHSWRAQEDSARLRAALEASEAESSQRDYALAAAQARLQAEAEQRLQVEAILQQSHKMEAMGKLTGGVAHDFNNLLQGICGSLELMQVRASQGRTAELGNYIEAALASANRAALLANRLLTFSQRRAYEPRPGRLSQVVGSMEELFRRTVGPMIRIETRHAAELWPSLCDLNQIESALLDLVINARDAMQDGGVIVMETANVFVSKATAAIHDVPPGEYAVLSVSDNGTGMTDSVKAQAFDLFFTTKPSGQGAGLGLAMVDGLMQQAGGHIRLRSEVGQGTTVTLYLPRFLGLVNEAELAAAPGGHAAKSSVLVVDDEPAARMFVSDVLSDAGYTVMEAHDSRSGLHALESEARIDLMVTDVGLPGGMNGRQLADAARQRRPGLKVLFVTGYNEGGATRNQLLDDDVLVMTKPFGMEALKATVEGIIGR